MRLWINKKNLEARARELRFHQTKAERAFGRLCKEAWPDIAVKHQAVIGRYIVDFYFPDRQLVIEIDGGQHADSQSDKKRDTALRRKGLTVMRFWNNEILENKEGCYTVLKNVLS